MKTCSTVIRVIHKRNILPSKEQVFFILFYCIFCMYVYIYNTAKGNTSLMLNKLLHNTEYLQCLS